MLHSTAATAARILSPELNRKRSTPFDLHVTPTVSMRCQQCYARDPHAATTAFAVCGAFVPRAAAPPRRFFAEPAP